MDRSPFRPLSLLPALAILFATGCSTARPGTHPVPSEDIPDGRLITAAEIERSSARNAWDALRLVARVSLSETTGGTPIGMRMRGQGSLLLDDSPLVWLDGVQVRDVRYLRTVEASTIDSIELLSGVEGTLRYGTGSGGGAIVITTRMW